MSTLTEQACAELREVAAFIDKYAETLIGDMDKTYITDDGVRISFYVMQKNSINTVKVEKEHLAWEKREPND